MPGVALNPVGAPGAAYGAEVSEEDRGPVPAALCAATVKLYDAPLLRPEMMAAAEVGWATSIASWKTM